MSNVEDNDLIPADDIPEDDNSTEVTDVTEEVDTSLEGITDEDFDLKADEFGDEFPEDEDEEEFKGGFKGDVDLDVDSVVVVPSDKVYKSSPGRKKISNPISVTLADNLSIRKQLTDLGFDRERLEQELRSGDSEWISSIIRALESTTSTDETLLRAVLREESIWDTELEHEGVKLRGNRTKTSFSTSNLSVVSGNKATMLYDSLTTSGNTFEIPLWHSGIWLYVKRPTLLASLELDSKIANEKATIGRATRGASFSNDGFFISKHLVDFALAHTFDHNVKGADKDMLREMIDMRDIPSIAWGMALAEYPSGFPFEQVCTADINRCKHVTSDIVNLSKVHRPDHSMFNTEQRKFMSSRNRKRTIDELEKYRDSTMHGTKTVKITDFLTIVLKCPTVQEHIDAGYAWSTELEANTVNTFGTTISDGSRAAFENDQALATRLRNYAHWIDKIILNKDEDETSTVVDEETIYVLLNKLSSDRRDRNKVKEAVDQYVVDNILVIIGTPNYKCENCGSHMMTRKGPESVIIPWDAVSVFFNLQQFKLQTNMGD